MAKWYLPVAVAFLAASSLMLPSGLQAATALASPSPLPLTLEEASIANQNAQAAYYRSQVTAPARHELPPWLNAILPLVALVLGSLLTYLVAARQAGEAQHRLYKRQKTQVRAAVRDLIATLQSLRLDDHQPFGFLQERFLIEQPERPRVFNRSDPYYQKYDLVDLIYRLCAVLGWMELYRVDPSFLSGPAKDKRRLEESFRAIREALSAEFPTEKAREPVPGNPNLSWADGVILEDDQRAIGETMLTAATKENPPAVLGYAAFCVSLFRFAKKENDVVRVGDQNFWIWNATRFVVDMGGEAPKADFRRYRLKKVLSELDKLNAVLDGPQVSADLQSSQTTP